MATTVIIPARNEEKTIGNIVRTFNECPETHGRVFVGIDGDTTDNTRDEVLAAEGVPIRELMPRGKGQVVVRTLQLLHRLPGMLSGRIILCDGDYTGLTTDHVEQITKPSHGMILGIPDWPEIDVPVHVLHAWPRVTGFRCLPWPMIPASAHGYLLETQLNLHAIQVRMPIKQIFMEGLKSPFQYPLSDKRMSELLRDKEWGERHGVL